MRDYEEKIRFIEQKGLNWLEISNILEIKYGTVRELSGLNQIDDEKGRDLI